MSSKKRCDLKFLILLTACCLVFSAISYAQSSNGSYALMQETVSSAGGVIGGGNPMRAQTMLGMPAAGMASNSSYRVVSGLAPTAEAVEPPVTMAITVSGTVDDATASVVVNGAAAPISAGTFSAQNVILLLGPNTLTATATDSAGNSASRSITVYLDLPETKKTPRFSVTARGPIDDSSATVIVNGVPAAIAAGEFSASVPLTTGLNTLTATATDAAGNSATKSIRVFVPQPTRPPAKPTVGTVGDPIPPVTTQTSMTIGGTKTAGTSIWINDNEVVALDDATAWSAAIALVEGDNVLRIITKDATATASAESVATITVDNQPPVVTFQPPAKTNLSPLLLTGSVDDSHTRVTINGVGATRNGLSFQVSLPLTLGANTLNLIAISPNGYRTERPYSLTRGTIPTVQSVQPADGAKLYAATALIIQISAADQEADPIEYRALLDGQPLTAWSASVSSAWTPSLGQAGSHTLQAEARDAYGGSSTKDVEVFVLREPVSPP